MVRNKKKKQAQRQTQNRKNLKGKIHLLNRKHIIFLLNTGQFYSSNRKTIRQDVLANEYVTKKYLYATVLRGCVCVAGLAAKQGSLVREMNFHYIQYIYFIVL